MQGGGTKDFENKSDVVITHQARGWGWSFRSLGVRALLKWGSPTAIRRFFQHIPEDATKSNQETVKAFVTQAIAKQELQQSANDQLFNIRER